MSNYVSTVSRKVGMLALAIVICNIVIVYVLEWYLSLPLYTPLIVGLIPILFFAGYCLRWVWGKPFVEELAKCKYNKFVPFYFYHQETPVRSERVNVTEINRHIRAGDVVLRRQEAYLDGFVFSANSFFTHAGICCNRSEGGPLEMMHANVEKGVHISTIEEFCQADDIAILRFSFSRSQREEDMLNYISLENRPRHDIAEIKNRELATFNSVNYRLKPWGGQFDTGDNQAGEYIRIVIERAYSLEGESYDTNFEFNKFDKLSCIEFVWYCFKSLFPLHRIAVEDFEFFGIFKMPVIVPDVFIQNDFFEPIYTSLPTVQSKKDLITHIKRPRKELRRYLLALLGWNLIFTLIIYLIFKALFPGAP